MGGEVFLLEDFQPIPTYPSQEGIKYSLQRISVLATHSASQWFSIHFLRTLVGRGGKHFPTKFTVLATYKTFHPRQSRIDQVHPQVYLSSHNSFWRQVLQELFLLSIATVNHINYISQIFFSFPFPTLISPSTHCLLNDIHGFNALLFIYFTS